MVIVNNSQPPHIKNITDAAIFERGLRLANEAIFTLTLQHRRLYSKEPEDKEFIFRRFADFQFFIIALNRFLTIEKIFKEIPRVRNEIQKAIDDFKKAIPGIEILRNTGEHINDYTIDKGYNKKIKRQALEVYLSDGTTYDWLGVQLNVDNALIEAERLFSIIIDLKNTFEKK